MSIPKNNTSDDLIMDVLNDISINTPSKEFYDKAEMRIVLNPLVCGMQWRSEIEAFEYLSHVIDLTYLAVLKFLDGEKLELSFWKPILEYYYDERKAILKNTESSDYRVLANFYPMTRELKDCQKIVSQLHSLVVINKQTKGVNNLNIRQKGKQLYETLSDTFDKIGEAKYMSYKNSMIAYKTLVLNGLSDMIRLENMEAVGGLVNKEPVKVDPAVELLNKDGDNKVKSKTEEIAVPVSNTDKEPIKADTVHEHTETSEVQSEGSTTVVERATDKPVNAPVDNPVIEVKMAGEEPIETEHPVRKIPLEQTVNMSNIEKLIDGKGFDNPKALLPREEWLKVFITEFQDVNTRCCMANRQNDTEAVDFYKDLLKSLFISYFNQRYLTDKSKHTKGFKPDFEKWDEAKDNILKTLSKLDMNLGIKVDGKWI